MCDRARILVAGLALAGILVSPACASSRARPQPGVSVDEWINAEVRRVLQRDERVDATTITVETHEGVVILTGIASSLDEIRRALRLAGRVDGALQIVNRLRLSPASAQA